MKYNLTTNASNEAENPAFLVGAVIGSASRSILLGLGFNELPHSTITASLIYDLGRNRQLSFGSIGTPNEMLYIYEIDEKEPKKITDLVCLRNYDYDGFTSLEQIKSIINLITGRVF